MAIAMTVDNPNGSEQQYEQVQARLAVGATPPPGAIFQMSGPGPEGGWRIVSVWESEEDASRFWDERVRPALEAAGGDPTPCAAGSGAFTGTASRSSGARARTTAQALREATAPFAMSGT